MVRRVFILALLALIGGCGDSGPEYPPGATEEQKQQILKFHTIKKLGSNIVSVSEEWDGQRLMLKYQPKSVFNEASWVSSFLQTAHTVMKGLQEAAPGNAYKQIMFDVQLPTVDRLGNSGFDRGMLIQYNWEDLKRANWGNLYAWDAGNLAEKLSFQRLGLSAAIEYCKDESNLKYARPFCTRVQTEALSRIVR